MDEKDTRHWPGNSRSLEITTAGTIIFLRIMGEGPPLLLLHGFPQTHLMWRQVAVLLSNDFTFICPDLRGYGQSGCPLSDKHHTLYTKRAMASDMVTVMEQLGYSHFSIAGHDRGGRVAYRLALDHPDRLEKLAVLDIVPTSEAWDYADREFALAFWPWTLLSQPAPLPEQLIAGAPAAVVENALSDWGSPAAVFPLEVKEQYIMQFRDPVRVHAICEDYRAAVSADDQHDRDDWKNGKRIQCPVHVLWSKMGPLDTWFGSAGGPLGIWRKWADHVTGKALNAGHFFPEEIPDKTASALKHFFIDH